MRHACCAHCLWTPLPMACCVWGCVIQVGYTNRWKRDGLITLISWFLCKKIDCIDYSATDRMVSLLIHNLNVDMAGFLIFDGRFPLTLETYWQIQEPKLIKVDMNPTGHGHSVVLIVDNNASVACCSMVYWLQLSHSAYWFVDLFT